MISRAERSSLGEWWWTVDRLTLGALLGLMAIGILLAFAGSPAVATRLGVDMFHFVNRQALFLAPALLVLIVTSFLSPRHIRRVALWVFVGSYVALVLTLFIGAEIKGARRWISFLGFTLQPSELVKPSFIVLLAWLFSESVKRTDMHARIMALGLLALVVIPLVLQPDIGQTTLILVVFAALFYLSGLRAFWVLGLGGMGAGGLALAYFALSHVRKRFDAFFVEAGGAGNSQTEKALQSFQNGGWLGRGVGEGLTKRSLPDSHTDFIISVGAEEFGIVLTLIVLSLFAFIVLRALNHALKDEDAFSRFAIVGLAMLFGLQAAINLMVNLSMIPAKGMTLPFVSYGGSSLISLAFGMGMLLALTRRKPQNRP